MCFLVQENSADLLNCERLKKTAKKVFARLSWAFFLFNMNSDIKNIKKLIIDQSLELDCGKTIKDFPLLMKLMEL